MSRLQWDETGKRKYENGISHVALYTRVPWDSRTSGYDFVNVSASAQAWANDSSKEHPYGIRIDSFSAYDCDISRVCKFTQLNHTEDLYYPHEINNEFSVSDVHTVTLMPRPGGGTIPVVGTYHRILYEGMSNKWFGEFVKFTDTKPMKDDFLAYINQTPDHLYSSLTDKGTLISNLIFDYSTRDKVIVEPFKEDDGIMPVSGVYIYPDGWTQSQLSEWPTTEQLVELGFTGETETCPFFAPRPVEDSRYVYASPWNGVTSISENPDGADANDLWADNIKYSSPRSVENFGITIEAYTYPDAFSMCDGSREPIDGVKMGQQKRNDFCLAYRTEVGSDSVSNQESEYLLHLIYGLTASPTDRAYQTINDSPDAITFSWECSSNPVQCVDEELGYNFKPVSSITIDSSKVNDRDQLSMLEQYLFGSDDFDGKIIYPVDVLRILDN